MSEVHVSPAKSQLRRIPVLSAVSEETLQQIERRAKRLNFGKGQEMISRWSEQDDLYILQTGQARVIVFSASGKAVNFRRVDPGDIFGEFAAIDGDRRSATVEAIEPSTALCMGAAVFREMMERDT